MAGRNPGGYIFCQECCSYVEIIHGDINYSTFTHIGTHRPLQMMKQEENGQVIIMRRNANSKNQERSNYCCPICNEQIKIFGNDISFCLRQHAQKHNSTSSQLNYTRSEGQSSNSSNRSKALSSSKRNERRNVPNPKQFQNNQLNNFSGNENKNSVLDNIFKSMPITTHRGMKFQKGFFTQKGDDIFCKICHFKVESQRDRIEEHIKSKRHEDNILKLIKNELPPNLQDTLEHVIMYGSNLSCNLCKCTIHISSFSVKESIDNILQHNASPSHLDNSPKNGSNEVNSILKQLSHLDSTINENMNYIEAKMVPEYKCTLCNKHIDYNPNQNVQVSNFNLHFNSASHNKCFLANSVLDVFRKSFPHEMRNHNLTIHKTNILCLTCKCSVETSFDKLLLHVKGGINSLGQNKDSTDLMDNFERLNFQESNFVTNEKNTVETSPKEQNKGKKHERQLQALLKTLPKPFKNIRYIEQTQNNKVKCLLCNCLVAANTLQLKMHLKGSFHPTGEDAKTVSSPLVNNVSGDSSNFNKNVKTDLSQSNKTEQPTGGDTDSQQNAAKRKEKHIELLELLKTLPQPYKNIKYVVRTQSDKLKCLICNCLVEPNTQDLKNHLKGRPHPTSNDQVQNSPPSKVNNETNVAKDKPILPDSVKDHPYIVESGNGQATCLVCSCIIPATTVNINDHLNGGKHLKNVTVFLNNSDENLIPENKTPKTNTSEVEKINNQLSNTETCDLVKKLFSDLPITYQRDMRHIEKSNQIDGFVQCTLCKLAAINPSNLKEHLDEENHTNKMYQGETINAQSEPRIQPTPENPTQNNSSPGSLQGGHEAQIKCSNCGAQGHQAFNCTLLSGSNQQSNQVQGDGGFVVVNQAAPTPAQRSRNRQTFSTQKNPKNKDDCSIS